MYQIWLTLKGKNVKDKKIDAELIGKYLTQTERLFSNIVRSSAKRHLLQPKDLHLYLTDFRGGSVKCVLEVSDYQKSLLGEPLSKPIIETFTKTFQVVKESDEEKGLEELRKIHEDKDQRIRILGNLKHIWPESKELQVSYEVIYQNESIFHQHLEPRYRERIVYWLGKELEEYITIIRGVIMRLRLDGKDKHFYVIDEEGSRVKCVLDSSWEEDVINLIKQPVYLRGRLRSKTRRSRTIEEVLELEPLKTITFNPATFPYLKQPMEFTLTYEDDLWVAQFPELDLTLYANTYNELKNEFAVEVEYLVEILQKIPDNQLISRLRDIKHKVHEYIDVERYFDDIKDKKRLLFTHE